MHKFTLFHSNAEKAPVPRIIPSMESASDIGSLNQQRPEARRKEQARNEKYMFGNERPRKPPVHKVVY